MSRTSYIANHLRKIKRIESLFFKRMYKALRSDFIEFSRALKSKGMNEAVSDLYRITQNDEIGNIILDIYNSVGLSSAKKTIKEINATEEKGFGINEELVELIKSYFNNYLLNKAVLPISETTRQNILSILKEAQEKGWGVDKIAFQLETTDFPLYRARMIVRTETLKAQFYGQKIGREKAKWESEKTWLAADDFRTRHSHNVVDDMKRDDKEKFPVPVYKTVGGGKGKKGIQIQVGFDYMDGPGDPNASAGNVINCRCTLTHKAKRDENGRLIPIRRITVIQPGRFTRNNPVITI